MLTNNNRHRQKYVFFCFKAHRPDSRPEECDLRGCNLPAYLALQKDVEHCHRKERLESLQQMRKGLLLFLLHRLGMIHHQLSKSHP